jgi:hypothetical protein
MSQMRSRMCNLTEGDYLAGGERLGGGCADAGCGEQEGEEGSEMHGWGWMGWECAGRGGW